MLVVSDTSPLNYLILIGAADVLGPMYGRVIVPQAVADELSADAAPAVVRTWVANRPAWVEVLAAPDASRFAGLDRGEAEAIALAMELRADLLLIDERKATRIAREGERLATTGTLGVLLDAALTGLLDLPTALDRLENGTTFQAAPALFRAVLAEYQRRRSGTRP